MREAPFYARFSVVDNLDFWLFKYSLAYDVEMSETEPNQKLSSKHTYGRTDIILSKQHNQHGQDVTLVQDVQVVKCPRVLCAFTQNVARNAHVEMLERIKQHLEPA